MLRTLITPLLLLAAPLAITAALGLGSVDLGWEEIWQALWGADNSPHTRLILDLRLPRALSAFAVGGSLALSGALLQVLLRNPLADPYILGISGGAAVAALLSILAGISGTWLTGNAFMGSLISMMLVFSLAHSQRTWTPTRLLLTGVVIAAGWGAMISFILAAAPGSSLHGMLFWLMGDLSNSQQPWPGAIVLVAGLMFCFPLARALNLLSRGELTATALGENPVRLKYAIYIVASLLTATAVTMAGSIGFVGLIIPHMLRLLGANDHRLLLPNSVLLGGTFLVIADTLARSIMAPLQLPVGVVTALLGVPIFLYLLSRSGQHDTA